MDVTVLKPPNAPPTEAEKLMAALAVMPRSHTECIIPLEQAMEFLGLTHKRSCVRILKREFEPSKDFSTSRVQSTGGRPELNYKLSVECFKAFCLMSGSPEGKRIRSYYIELERQFYSSERLPTVNAHVVIALLYAMELGMIPAYEIAPFLQRELSKGITPSELKKIDIMAHNPKLLEETMNKGTNR